ncbi:hypothetical protein [Scleromatobacter humisilvae]|uniref:PEP-CTERM protein-sorting domain-containing protein n=1 Tax=Scleromatobacter humisilvae TaxID=2897159 RepID=A0A9X1YM36_9BURK|nr:hypothetical protein [Scleromatobacter humisilvae]MCK9684186.1 hypothetical protein [Scleromatobacter humisilvae]
MRGLLFCTIAGVLAVVDPAAQAAGTADVELSGLQVHLVDLDPGDGIAPSVAFDSTGGGSYLDAIAENSSGNIANVTRSGDRAFDSLSGTTGATPHFGAAMTLAGDIFGGGLVAHGSAYTTGQEYGDAGADVWFFKVPGQDVSALPFTLSPETALTISGLASGSMSTTEPNSDALLAEVLLAFAPSLTALGNNSVTDSDALVVQAGQVVGGGASADREQSLSVTFVNATDVDATGVFEGFVRVDASTAVLADEPSPLLLMAGAAALAAIARAKRRMRDAAQGALPGRAP